MPQATYNFPNGFLWGTATSSHQVEGNNTHNNWSAWENQPGRILHDHKAGLAADWWGGRWRDDFNRAAEAHQNAHRLSIEWSRVQPEPDRWNDDALDVYREMLRWLYNHNMTPVVTLHHFTDPLWLTERGGWENPEAPALFEAYVRRAVDALREYTSYWVTINEPNVYVYSGYMEGAFPPGKRDMGAAFHVMSNLLRGHARAYRAIKSIQKEARVGVATHYRGFQPARPWLPLDVQLVNLMRRNFNAAFLDTLTTGRLHFLLRSARMPEVVGTQDYVGLNYYTEERVAFNLFRPGHFFSSRFYPPGAEQSDTGFIANVPRGFYRALQWAHGYNLPILVTENGVEDADDHLRPRYLVEHLHQLWRAINNNWMIKGYFYWSLVDNFEWERGWTQRFGLWGLDVDSQARQRRPSVDLYDAICKENALSYSLVAQYAPEALPALFPGLAEKKG